MTQPTRATLTPEQAHDHIDFLRNRIQALLIGQDDVVDQVLIALLCRGHVLLEGVPGLGKTLLVRALAHCFAGQFRRIQFTPDLMPADMTGHAVYHMQEGSFHIRRGPIFTNLLLADEINRSPAKTQAALLEVMQEQQVTIEGESHALTPPFMVLATQNPVEQEGTYPLPEAQLDRFLLKVFIDYPTLDDEARLVRQVTSGALDMGDLEPGDEETLQPSQILALQAAAELIAVDEQVLNYAVRLVQATRQTSSILKGAGPRASIGLVNAAKAWALMNGRDFVLPDDIKQVSLPVMRHRILLAPESEIDGLTPDQVLKQLIQTVDAPRT
ncbi:AAA family ATPase [Terasakiispira papahanaumokuakeensis]|uniref:AAA family ATPase n=1 Tax=Terasakiispira papahanaumokuakeensis TaxID=197479 RepID=A0A1E2V6G4_9GAMM|nr:MoxR family ATPase [Terasakiispira papahanaumokuakeensis]ODC02503.1 AAA family ATPase [Terasakiispira papahanaumokuakeensis]